MATFLRDVRYALRVLRRTPMVTGIALLALALGTVGATAVLSIARSLLYEHLPYADPDRLFVVWPGSFLCRHELHLIDTS